MAATKSKREKERILIKRECFWQLDESESEGREWGGDEDLWRVRERHSYTDKTEVIGKKDGGDKQDVREDPEERSETKRRRASEC
jgi:hypothetical protein